MKLSGRPLALVAFPLASILTLVGCASETAVPSVDASKGSTPSQAGVLVVTTAEAVLIVDGESGSRVIAEKPSLMASESSDARFVYLRERGGAATWVLNLTGPHGAELVQEPVESNKPTHVVSHDGRTVIYNDGTGAASAFAESDLLSGALDITTIDSGAPHHGVAAPLGEGYVITVPGENVLPDAVSVRDAEGRPTGREISCPALHGEGIVGDFVAFGCQDAVLILGASTETMIAYPSDSDKRVGVFASPLGDSPVLAGSYYDAGEPPTALMLVDTAVGTATQVDLESAFTAFTRSGDDQVVVALANGRLAVVDPNSGQIERMIDVAPAGERDMAEMPVLAVHEQTAYVGDPMSKTIYIVDLLTGETTNKILLDAPPTSLAIS